MSDNSELKTYSAKAPTFSLPEVSDPNELLFQSQQENAFLSEQNEILKKRVKQLESVLGLAKEILDLDNLLTT